MWSTTGLLGCVGWTFPERYGGSVVQLAMDVVEHRGVPSATIVKHRLIRAGNLDRTHQSDLDIDFADATPENLNLAQMPLRSD